MIKNVALKVFLQNTVFSLFSCLNQRLKHNDRKIMLYSNLGFRDNIKALYDYIIEAGYNEKYTIICSANDYKIYQKDAPKNVKFVSNIKGILEYFSSGFVFYCFGKLPIFHGKDQRVIQVWHGCPFKGADDGHLKGHSFDKPYYSNVLSTSKHFAPIWSRIFSIDESKIIIGGYPRCDALFKESPNYDFGSYKKIILWAPTFRKSDITGYSDTKNNVNIVPVLDNRDFEYVNNELRKIGVKLVVKLHPVQSLDGYETKQLENFVLLSHQEFVRRNMDLYRFMVQCDALITDYSSVFFDYILLDRPMAFTEDDIDDYGETRGFEVENPSSYKPGDRIKTREELLKFANDVAQGCDQYKEDRKRVQSLSNEYINGNFSQKLLETVGIVK